MARIRRSSLVELTRIVGALWLAMACSSQAADPGPSVIPPVSDDAPLDEANGTCGITSLGLNARGVETVDVEAYSYDAINARLADYPELAEALGVTSVADCEGARSFMRGYRQYQEDHPDFDDFGPPKEVALAALLAEAGTNPAPAKDPKVPKLMGPERVNPTVVRFYRTVAVGGGPLAEVGQDRLCTATRIAGPFYLTSAHCLPSTGAGPYGFDVNIQYFTANDSVDWYGQGQYGQSMKVVAYKYPGYMGKGDSDRDLGLIFIRPPSQAPLKADPYSWGAFAYLGSRAPLAPETESAPIPFGQPDLVDVFGWGVGFDNEPTAQARLRGDLGVGLTSAPRAKNHFSILNIGTDPRTGIKTVNMCKGDSGGPAQSSPTGFVVGVTSSTFPDIPDAACVGLGATQQWTRVDRAIPWLQQSMANAQVGGNERVPSKCKFFSGSGTMTDPENISSFWNCNWH